MSHSSLRLCGSSPVVGSSRNRTGGRGDEAGGEVEAAAHAAGEGLRPGGRRRRRARAARAARRRACGASRRRQVVEAADHLEVRAGGQQAVDGRLPGRRRRSRARTAAGSATTSSPATARRALVGGAQRGEDADRRRLAGAVVAEQAEHGARRGRRGRGRAAPRGRRSACRGPCGDDSLPSQIVRTRMLFRTSYDQASSTLYEMSRAVARDEHERPIWARPEPGPAGLPHARADRRRRARDRRRRGLRGRLDAPRRRPSSAPAR